MRLKKIYTLTVVKLLFTSLLIAQNHAQDVNGDGTLNILIIGTNQSINNGTEAFSPDPISTELQNILSADTSISVNVNVVSEDIYKVKNVTTGIANTFTSNLNYYCHSLLQYYYWPDGHINTMDNLKGNFGVKWDYVVIGADPYIVSTIPGYYSLGVNKVAEKIIEGGAIPLLLMMWSKDETLIDHFEEFTYRASEGAKIQIETIPTGLAWKALPSNLKDTASIHPTPNGAFLAAASIYSHLYQRSASNSQYSYNQILANLAYSTVIDEIGKIHYTGKPNFISPYKNCEVVDSNLIYNHGGTSTENGILNGLQWVVTEAQKTLQYGSTPPIHFNYGRSSMGSTHLYVIDSTLFDFSFGYPLQDDQSTGEISMQYGIDKRVNDSDVETDLGVALNMVRQSELPFARNVPLRTIVSQMIEEIPGVDIYNDPWHMSDDLNMALGSYIYTLLTSDCVFKCTQEPTDQSTPEWRTWMSIKIGHETAWNLMYLEETSPCYGVTVDAITSCDPYIWIDGNTYTAPNSTAKLKLLDSEGCDSTVMLHLTNRMNSTISILDSILTANEVDAIYQWLNCPDMTIIEGATSQTYTVLEDGGYAVVIKKNSCTDTSSCQSIVSPTDLNTEIGDEFLIYPNPADGNFSVNLGNIYTQISVSITNVTGQKIYSRMYLNEKILNFDVDLLPGVYFIIIAADESRSTIQLIKK